MAVGKKSAAVFFEWEIESPFQILKQVQNDRMGILLQYSLLQNLFYFSLCERNGIINL